MGSTDTFLSSITARSAAKAAAAAATGDDESNAAASSKDTKAWSQDTLPPLQTSLRSTDNEEKRTRRSPPPPISTRSADDADAVKMSSPRLPNSPPLGQSHVSSSSEGDHGRYNAAGQHPTRFWGPVSGYSEGGLHARNRASTLSLPRPSDRLPPPRFSPTYPPGHPAATSHMAAGTRAPFASPYSAGSSGSSARDSITTLGSSLWDEQRSRRDSNVSTATSLGPDRCSPAISASHYPPHQSPYSHAPVSPYQLTAQLPPRSAIQQAHLAPGRNSHPSPPMSPIMMESLSVDDHPGPYHPHPPPPPGHEWEAHHGGRGAAWHHPDSPYARGSPLLSSSTGMPLPGFVGGGSRGPMRSPRASAMELAQEEQSYFNYSASGYAHFRGPPGSMPHSPQQWHSQVPPPMGASNMGPHGPNGGYSHNQGVTFARPVGPDRLAHTRRRRRPPCSYASLITQAIQSSEEGRLTLREIYMWISQAYPGVYPLDGPDAQGWQNTVRHNLSLNKAFIKVARTAQEVCDGNKAGAASGASKGKGGWWTLDQDVMEVRRLQQEELLGLPGGSSGIAGLGPGSDEEVGEGSQSHAESSSKKARSNGDSSPEMGLGLVLDRPGSGDSADNEFGPSSLRRSGSMRGADDDDKLPSVLRPSTAERRGSLGGEVGLLSAPSVPSSYPFSLQGGSNTRSSLPRIVAVPGRTMAGRARGYTMSAADAALRGSIAPLPASGARRALPPLQTSSTTRHVKSHTLTPTLSQIHLSPQKRKIDIVEDVAGGSIGAANGTEASANKTGHVRLRSVSSVDSSQPPHGLWSKSFGAGFSGSPPPRRPTGSLGLSGLSTLSGAATRDLERVARREGEDGRSRDQDRMQVDEMDKEEERRIDGDEEMGEAATSERPTKSPRFATLSMDATAVSSEPVIKQGGAEADGAPKTPSMSISGLLNG